MVALWLALKTRQLRWRQYCGGQRKGEPGKGGVAICEGDPPIRDTRPSKRILLPTDNRKLHETPILHRSTLQSHTFSLPAGA